MIKCRAAGVLNILFKLYECEPNFIWKNKGAVEGKYVGWTWSGKGERKCRRL